MNRCPQHFDTRTVGDIRRFSAAVSAVQHCPLLVVFGRSDTVQPYTDQARGRGRGRENISLQMSGRVHIGSHPGRSTYSGLSSAFII